MDEKDLKKYFDNMALAFAEFLALEDKYREYSPEFRQELWEKYKNIMHTYHEIDL